MPTASVPAARTAATTGSTASGEPVTRTALMPRSSRLPTRGARPQEVAARSDRDDIAHTERWMRTSTVHQRREDVGPEGVVAGAQVGVARAEQRVREEVEPRVARVAQRRDVVAAAALGEPAALGEVRARDQRRHERRD